MRSVLCGLRYHDYMLSILYAIGPMHALSNQRYRHYMLSSGKSIAHRYLSRAVSIVVLLITTRLGVLVLIRNTPLLCFSLGWLLLVVALLLPFIILLCGC